MFSVLSNLKIERPNREKTENTKYDENSHTFKLRNIFVPVSAT